MQKKTLKKVSSLALGSSMFLMGMLPFGSAFAATNPMVSNMTLTESGNTFTAMASDPTGTAEYSFWVETPSGRWYQAQGYSTSNTFTLVTSSSGVYHVQAYALDVSQVQAGDWSLGVASSVDTYNPTGVVSSVTASASTSTASIGQTVTITGSATVTGGEPLYDFWVQSPNGTWSQVQGYSTSSSYALPITESGTYIVNVYALDSSQAGEYNLAQEATVTVTVGSPTVSATLTYGQNQTLSNNGSLPQGDAVTIMPSATGLTNPLYQVWVESPDGMWTNEFGYAPAPADGITIPTPMAGTYTINVYASNGATPGVNPVMASYVFSAFGQAAAVKLSAASSSLVADGAATDTITATVVDANGNTVGNFNGSVTITSSTGDIVSGTTTVSSTTVSVVDGQATVQVKANTTVGETITLTPSALLPASSTANIVYSPVTVTEVAPSATQLALSVMTGSPTALSANVPTTTTVVISAEDTAGNVFAGNPGEYVTVNVSGPGTLVGGATSKTVFVSTTGSVQVESEQGQTGTITVSVSGAGLTPSSISIPTYVNTAPTSLSVSATTGTDANGNAYTEYTVQVLDSNGHLVSTASGSLDITSNASTVSGAIFLGTLNTSGAFTDTYGVNSYSGIPINNGVATFVVETKTVGTAPVSLTLDDVTQNLSGTATYAFAAGSPSTVTLTPSATSIYDVEAGQTVTYSAQLVDANNNTVAESGQSVTFTMVSDSADATFPNGLASGATYTATTNAQGVASVTVSVPASAASGTSFEIEATYGTATPVTGATVSVLAPSAYVTQVSVSGTPTAAVTGGNPVGPFTITTENAVQTPVSGAAAGDTLQITTSNSNVVELVSGGVAVSSLTVTATTPDVTVTTTSGVWGLMAEMAGAATITVTDISNPTKPSAQFTVDVVPGSATSTPLVEYNGKPISSANELSLSANSPVPLQVVNVDAGGNPVPVTGSSPLQVDLFSSPNPGNFEAAPGGAAISDVFIPAGQESVTVYYVAPTATTISGNLTAEDAHPASLSVTPAGSATIAAGNATTYTFTVLDQNGNPLDTSGITLTASLTGTVTASAVTLNGTSGITSTTITTNSSGQATVTVVDTKATNTYDVTAVVSGTSVSATTATQTIVAAAPASAVISVSPSTATTSGTTVTVTLTLTDQYGNTELAIGREPVTFTDNATSAQGTPSSGTGTLTSGTATFTFTTGSSPTGTVTFTGSVAVSGTTFTGSGTLTE